MQREPTTPDERDRRRSVLLAVVGALALAGIAWAWQSGGAGVGPAVPAVDDTPDGSPEVAAPPDGEPGASMDDVADDTGQDPRAADAPAFHSDRDMADDGLPGGAPSPQVDPATGLRTDLLVLAVDRGTMVVMDPNGREGFVELDEDTDYLDLAVRPGSSAADATVAVVADGSRGTRVEVVRAGGGRLLADPTVVAAVDRPVTGLVWAGDGTVVAWTDGERLTAAEVSADGTAGAAVDLGSVRGRVAAWSWEDDGAATGTVTLAVPRDDGGLDAELRRVTRDGDGGFVLGEVVETSDRLVLDADATDSTGTPVQWVIQQTAEQVTLGLTGAEDAHVATVPITAAPVTYVVGGGVAVVVTDMNSNDGIQRVTVDGAVTEIALWRAYDVLD